MARRKTPLPIDYCLNLRARGYSYEMIAYKLRKDFDIDVSKWTIMRRLRPYERSSKVNN